MIYRTIIFAALCLLLAGCSGSQHDARLQQLAAQIDDDPHSAVEALDSLNGSTFSEADRHYYDLLLIKARDKAYIFHTSDSLILDVINYYADHQDANLYAEALYYGGRVYSDMGDYPSALHYFQSALDLLPADTPNLKLRGNVLSQTGRLLDTLRLFEQASHYIKEVIKLDSICNDTLNWMYDIQLLGDIYYRERNYNKAEPLLLHARQLAKSISPVDTILHDSYLAEIQMERGNIDSAVGILSTITSKFDILNEPLTLTITSNIYVAANQLDSAYKYANKLIHGPRSFDTKTGYHTILSSKLINRVPQDSLVAYVLAYRDLMESDLNQNDSQQAMLQNSIYNYSVHEREHQKAERDKEALYKWIVGTCLAILLLAVALLILRIRYKNKVIQLHIALENINKLTEKLNIKSEEGATSVVKTGNVAELRLQLRNKFIELAKSDKQSKTVDSAIICSEAFAELRKFIDNEKSIKDDDELWGKIEATVLGCAPNFKTNLQLLTGGKLSRSDYRTALLIRCGITPSEMAILLGRSKGAISSRREYLGYKIFDEKLGTKLIDDIIRLL
jgi:tetratricopeptide (TPR) repeat protein